MARGPATTEAQPLIAQAQGRPGFASPFEEMEDAFNSGWIDFGVPGTKLVAGKVAPAQIFEQARKAEKVSDHENQPGL